jgi:hypothetical protein
VIDVAVIRQDSKLIIVVEISMCELTSGRENLYGKEIFQNGLRSAFREGNLQPFSNHEAQKIPKET